MRSNHYYLICLFLLWPTQACGETLAQEHNLKGVSYLRDRNMEKAKKEFRQAIKVDPDYAPAHNNLGYLLYNEAVTKSGEDGSSAPIKEALYHLQTALKHAASQNIIRQAKENLALLYTDTSISLSNNGSDWLKKGAGIYESLIQEQPDNPEYHMRLGFAYFNTANPGGGFSELNKASQLAQDKDTLWIHKELQRFYAQINFAAQAVREQKLIGTLERRQEGSK